MISWMQKNNKFLIITMWVATGSFILSGAVAGWSFSSKAESIGRVGSVELKRDRISMDYANQFNRFNQQMQGKFDKKQAEAMGLEKYVVNSVTQEAKLLNLAKEFGIIVTDEETGEKLASFPSFQKDGKFDREIYNTFIRNSPFHQDTFEESLKNQLIVQKTLAMLETKGIKSEYEAFKVAFEIGDKLKYTLLTSSDVKVEVKEDELKKFWESRKDSYKTAKKYEVDIQWTETKDTNVTDKAINEYYEDNKFNYKDSSGKIQTLADVKDWLIEDVKVKESYNKAYKRYLKYKEGELEKSERVTLDLNDPRLSSEIWQELKKDKINEITKPMAVNKKYASVKLIKTISPVTKKFEEVRESILPQYKAQAEKNALDALAKEKLTQIDNEELNVSTFITLNNVETQKFGLNQQETSDFVSKLFTSTQEKGIIPIGSNIVVYKIIEQKLIPLESNSTDVLYSNADQVKRQTFEKNLMEELDKKYPTTIYQ